MVSGKIMMGKLWGERMVSLPPEPRRTMEPSFVSTEETRGRDILSVHSCSFGWNLKIIQSPEGFGTLIESQNSYRIQILIYIIPHILHYLRSIF